MKRKGEKARIVQLFPDNRVNLDWYNAPKMRKRENEKMRRKKNGN